MTMKKTNAGATVVEKILARASAKDAVPSPEGTTLAPTWQSARSRPSSSSAEKRPRPRRPMSSRKTRSIGCSAQKSSTWSSVGVTERTVGSSQAGVEA